MPKFRPYQERDYKIIVETFKDSNDCLYQLPTGGGKSVVMEQYTLDNLKLGENQLILAHKRELVFQMRNRLAAHGINVGIIIGSIEENVDAPIVVASIRTVAGDKRIQTILERKFDRITVDECHRIRTASYEKLLDTCFKLNPKIKLLGVSATPYRLDKKPLNKYFNNLICSDDIPTLQRDGYLAKCRVFYTPTPNLSEEVENSGPDYQLQSLSNFMRKEQMLDFLVDSYEKEGNSGQMLIFCVDKKHAKDVRDKYISRGYKSIAHIDSDTDLKVREEILASYAQGEIQIITCIETLTEGIDLPETKVVQLARPTQSLVLYLQMVGRGLRLKSDGGDCVILDNAGCTLMHKMPGSPRNWTLNPDIDPSTGARKTTIVGKRKDGSFTEDENEMAFLELVEMTPEEYASNMHNGIEKAEKFNETVKERITEELTKLSKFLISKLKESKYDVNERYINDRYSNNKVSLVKGPREIKLTYSPNSPKGKQLKFDSDVFWKDGNDHLQTLIDMGKLSEEVMVKKTYNQIINIFEAITELDKSKIDINELKKGKKSFDLEQWKHALDLGLKTNNVIKLKKPISTYKFGKNIGYRWEDIHTIQFHRNKLMAMNEISIYNKINVKVHTKKYKLDELIGIIEDNWEF